MSDKPKVSYKELIEIEIKKCIESPVYFMRHYVKIQHPVKGTINFDLFPFQEETLQAFKDYKFNIILKSRQLGISTLVAAFSLWLMMFNKDKNILIISTKQDVSKELVSKVRFANDHLPTWLQIKCIEDNRLSLKFSNGSQVRAISSSGDAGRSMSVSLLILDEAGFIEGINDIWSAAWNTLSTGGNSIVLSTPNGIGNWFHRMWSDAETKSNDFHPIRLLWNLHPERDQSWRDEQTKNLGPKQAGQECDCDFLSSGDNVVDLAIIEYYKKNVQKDPLEIRGADKGLWIWQYPDYSHSYIVSSDVARGDGLDFSACHVLDITGTMVEQVAEYKGTYGTKDFGNFLVELATMYRDALLIVENATVGWSTVQTIIDRQYKNMFYSSADLRYVDVQRQLTNRWDSDEKHLVPGFSTTIRTRPLIINALDLYFREKAINIYSRRTLAELDTFIWKNGKAQAMEPYNDDLVMSLAIGLWVRDTAMKLRQEGIYLTKSAIDSFKVKKFEESNLPVYQQKQLQVARDSWQMKTGRQGFGNQNLEDLRWLIS